MHPPERKYQLFPKEKPGTPTAGKGLDPEQAFALAMGQNGEKTDKPSAGSALRLRIKEHNLNRRRKVSVPELGPMTTVQEVAMDSREFCRRPLLRRQDLDTEKVAQLPYQEDHHCTSALSVLPAARGNSIA